MGQFSVYNNYIWQNSVQHTKSMWNLNANPNKIYHKYKNPTFVLWIFGFWNVYNIVNQHFRHHRRCYRIIAVSQQYCSLECGLQEEEEPQTVYPMPIPWASQITVCASKWSYYHTLYFEMEPSVSMNIISLATSCVGFGRRSHKQPTQCPLHGHLI